MIKISVVIPIYKVPQKYLQACFDSLTNQTLQECEFILISDGAPKEVCSICKEYTAKDSRFKYYKRKHVGVSATRNYGIEHAHGEYITFVDSDDFILPNAVEIWYKQAKEWNSDIFITNYAESSAQKDKLENHLWKPIPIASINNLEYEIILNEFINTKSNSVPRGPCGKLYHRKLLCQYNIRFNTHLKIGEDFVFNFMCFSKASIISFYPRILYFYRNNPESVTRAFNPNYFYDRVAPLLEIQEKFPNKYDNLIANEVINIFFQSWPHCYMSPQNTEPMGNRIKKIIQIMNSDFFQKIISKANLKSKNLLIHLELFLIKKKITFFVWIHAIKALVIKQRV